MCRALSYLGLPILLEDLLYKPDNSFIKQSYHPIYMSALLNLAGFGMVAWENRSFDPERPYTYRIDRLPFYDSNLRNLTQKLQPDCLLTHIRGVSYSSNHVVSLQNVHPFLFANSNVAFAHNGALFEFETMKYDMLDYIKPEFQIQIQGTTDTEWLYALFLSQVSQPSVRMRNNDIANALNNMFKILRDIRFKHNIRVNSPVNFFISDGQFIAASRFVFDYGWFPLHSKHMDAAHLSYHSLWYTYGERYELYENEYKMIGTDKKSSIIIASEPLTEDTTTWIELPEYTCIIARLEQGEVAIETHDINV